METSHEPVKTSGICLKTHENEFTAEELPSNSQNIIKCSDNNPSDLLIEQIPDLQKYFIIGKIIGKGTFSNVFLVTSKDAANVRKYAVKHLYSTSHPRRIMMELQFLKEIGGCCNIVGLMAYFSTPAATAFVMPYFPHDTFSEYLPDMSISETRLYMKNLLEALERVHSFNVIHRDVKPSNFLYNRNERKFLLVDFGLSHFVNKRSSKIYLGRKRPLEVLEKDSSGIASKRRALLNLSTNVRENSESAHNTMTNNDNCKVNVPYKENSPLSKNLIVDRDIQNVKRNLQFEKAKLTTKSELSRFSFQKLLNVSPSYAPNIHVNHLKQNFRASTKEHSSIPFSVQTVQNSERFSISGQVVKEESNAKLSQYNACRCSGKPRICNICCTRKKVYAPRAGTPGYRSPEVLLKDPCQTTAVDVWAAGIIMVTILSGKYPFFYASNDMDALMEIIAVFGVDEVKSLATKLDRRLVTSLDCQPVDLRTLCERRLREGRCKSFDADVEEVSLSSVCNINETVASNNNNNNNNKEVDNLMAEKKYPDEAYDLLRYLLQVDPSVRYSSKRALKHPFFADC